MNRKEIVEGSKLRKNDKKGRKKGTGRHSAFSRKVSWPFSAIYDQRRFSIKNRKEVCPVTRADSLYNETKSWQRQIAVSSSWMPILVDFKTKIGIFTLLNSKLSKDFVRMSLFFFQIGWKLLIPVWNVVHKGYSKTVVSFLAKTTGMIAHRNFHHPPDKYPSFESSFLSFFKSDFWIGPGMVKNRPRAWPMDRLDLFSHSIA